MAIYNPDLGVFRGTQLIQRKGVIGGSKHVFVPMQGVKNELVFPTFGGVIANPFRGAAKLFAGDLAEYRTDENGKNPKYYILKTFEVIASSGTTTKVLRGGYSHIPFVGDVLMVAPDTIGGTGKGVTVTAVTKGTETVSEVTYDVWVLTTSSTLNSPAKGTVLVEAEEAGNDKAMVVKNINSVVDCDYDMYETPSTTFGSDDDTNFEDARYFVSFALGGLMYTNKMSVLPPCVLALNRSNVNGWFKVDYYDMNDAVSNAALTEQLGGVSIRYSSSAPTTSTKGKVGDIITNGSKIYVCSNVSGSTYTWVGAALS